jgi:hypothetical protein
MKSDLAGRGSLEARLDLLLGEEVQVNPEFARWFAAPALGLGSDMLDGLTAQVVRFNIWDKGGPPPLEDRFAGENDLEVVLSLANGRTAQLLIEDKVWAPFQRDQALRYRNRADSRPTAAAVLVAPRGRLGEANADGYFHKAWSIEELAEKLETQGSVASEALARRLHWRAQLLREMCVPTIRTPGPPHPPTVLFNQFCVAWLSREAPETIPNPDSMRTEGGGWLYFTQPKGLVYKVIGGVVDFDVVNRGFVGELSDLNNVVSRGDGPLKFDAVIVGGNPVLRWSGRAMQPKLGLPDDTRPIIDGLEACARVARWVAESPSCLAPIE